MEKSNELQTVESWMKDLSVFLGVELALDTDGICTFQIGENNIIGIEVSPDFPVVYIYSPIMALPTDDKDATMALMIRALELNAFQALTGGGAIAISPGGGPLLFCYSMPIAGADSNIFCNTLGSFFNRLPEIKNMLTTTSTMPPGQALPSGAIKL